MISNYIIVLNCKVYENMGDDLFCVPQKLWPVNVHSYNCLMSERNVLTFFLKAIWMTYNCFPFPDKVWRSLIAVNKVSWSDLSGTHSSLIGWPLFDPIQRTTFEQKGGGKKGWRGNTLDKLLLKWCLFWEKMPSSSPSKTKCTSASTLFLWHGPLHSYCNSPNSSAC